MFTALSDTARARLVKLLAMLNSTFDNERATAGALADRLIRECNLTWDQVAARPNDGQQHQGQSPSPPPRNRRDVVAECQAKAWLLTDWEERFLARVGSWRGSLTAKPLVKLNNIAWRVGVELAP
jgi:hypothetical protein